MTDSVMAGRYRALRMTTRAGLIDPANEGVEIMIGDLMSVDKGVPRSDSRKDRRRASPQLRRGAS